MGKLKAFMLVGVLFSIQFLWAQTQVTGRVTDARDGSPLPGVTVAIKNRNLSTTTGADGAYSISVPANSTLVFTYVGYQTIERTVTGGTVDVALTAGENALTEVVVTGYTTTQRKKFSGATTSVPTNDVRRQPFASFDQALQGQASGVSVIASSGQPGASAQVRIRGVGSIDGSNTPLYIIDGIQVNAGDFSTMNQGDFDRVEILKDAAATAQYGSRGANGVVVITTRRGRAGQIQLNYDAQLGFSNLPKDRLELMNSSQKVDYEVQRGNPFQWTAAEQDSLKKVNFNWQDALFQTGVTQQHMLSASGGSEASRFFASLSYLDQEGIVQTTGLKRFTGRINVDNTIKNFRFGLNLQGGYSKNSATEEGATFTNQPLNAIRWANPYERDRDPNTGDWNEPGGTGALNSGQPNPAMELFLNYNYQHRLKGLASSYLEFHFPFLRGLSARTNWGIDFSQVEGADFLSPETQLGNGDFKGALDRTLSRSLRYTGTTSLNFKRNFDRHEIEAGLFTEVVKLDARNFGFTGYGFTNGFTNESGITPGSTTNSSFIPSVAGSGSQQGILSYFSIINYGFDGKYYVSFVGRRDGSSRFGLNRRWANFGSIGLTWAIDQENFMENVTFFDDLRLRASIGTNGNQESSPAGPYPIPTFARTTYSGVSGWAPGAAGNLDYTWETNRTINLGVDFGILNRRLSGTVELYDRKTTNLFWDLPIDYASSGFGTLPGNFGTLRNRGIELMLRGDMIRNRDFTWSLEGNITYNDNEIVDLYGEEDTIPSGITALVKGQPIGSIYLVEYAGVNAANGNALYYTRDGNLTEVFNSNDRVLLGTSNAPWFGGLSTNFSYKGFDLSAQLNFFLNRVMYNNDRVNVTNPSYYRDNMSTDLLREWRKPGDITDVPRPTSSAQGGSNTNPFQDETSRFVEDASYWRLRNVTLGYNLPASVLSKAKIRSARVFVQGQNLWTSTKFRSFDPEMAGSSLVGAQYPALVQTTVGLSIGF